MIWPKLSGSMEFEQKKMAYVRGSIAIVLIYKSIFDYLGSEALSLSEGLTISPLLILVMSSFLLFGVLTRWSYLLLGIIFVRYNIDLQTMNLGPLFVSPLLIGCFFLDRQPVSSVDSYLVGKLSSWRRIALFEHNLASKDVFDFVYGVLFFLYAYNSFAAVVFHLQDSYWRSGVTVQAMMSNSFLSRFFLQFRSLEGQFPETIRLFSGLSGILQTIFQMLMIPLLFSRVGRWFVILHGLCFFIFSLLFLQISILPTVEIILWGLIFGSCIFNINEVGVREVKHFGRLQQIVIIVIVMASLLEGVRIYGQITGNRWEKSAVLSESFKYIGIWPPDVFNKTDLEMGQTWFTIERVGSKGRELVPFFSEQGGRLYYHLSDVVYYRNTLTWRRAVIGLNWKEDITSTYPMLGRIIANLCKGDYQFLGKSKEIKEYKVRVFQDYSMNANLSLQERYEVREIKAFSISVSEL